MALPAGMLTMNLEFNCFSVDLEVITEFADQHGALWSKFHHITFIQTFDESYIVKPYHQSTGEKLQIPMKFV